MAKFPPIEKKAIETCVAEGMTRDAMMTFFGCSRHHMQNELRRHGINLRNRSKECRAVYGRRKARPWDTIDDDDDLPDDFDPDSVPLNEIDEGQLTVLEIAQLRLGERLVEKPTGYFLDRLPVSVDKILKEAGLS